MAILFAVSHSIWPAMAILAGRLTHPAYAPDALSTRSPPGDGPDPYAATDVEGFSYYQAPEDGRG
jgi:hypothetical protein